MRIIVPAMRVAVAKKLRERGMRQAEIAKRLGVAQAAVSKYLNRGYSERIAILERRIAQNKLDSRIVELALSGDKRVLEEEMGRPALNSRGVCRALKLQEL